MNAVVPNVESPLASAIPLLRNTRIQALVAAFFPVPLVALGALAMQRFEPRWIHDPFLVILFGLFAVGQITAIFHLLKMRGRARRDQEILQILLETGTTPSPLDLEQKLVARRSGGHLQELVLLWTRMSSHAPAEAFRSVQENSTQRRIHDEERLIGFHTGLNRTILKVGFLGTLVGLLFTFPPMQRAMLGLRDSGGEMRFIKDIAEAIDHDAYAILATLVATGLSILVELLTIQILERCLGNWDVVESRLNDWNLSVLQPSLEEGRNLRDAGVSDLEALQALRESFSQTISDLDNSLRTAVETVTSRHIAAAEAMEARLRILATTQEQTVKSIAEAMARTAKDLSAQMHDARGLAMEQTAQIQAQIQKNVGLLAEAAIDTERHIAPLQKIQARIGENVSELGEYEKQYREFLGARQAVALPPSLRSTGA